MQKSLVLFWRRLGLTGQTFLILAAVFVALRLFQANFWIELLVGFVVFVLGVAGAFRIARRITRKAIWRLRNRLIAAYLFIAVVPIVLILALVGFAGKGIIGQMAVYLVNTELRHRESILQGTADLLTRFPTRDPELAVNRFVRQTRNNQLPDAQLLVTGAEELRYPPDSQLTMPPAEWKESGDQHLIVKHEAGGDRLYAWAYATHEGTSVLAIAPITQELLAGLVPGLGDVNYIPLMGHIPQSHVPQPANVFDARLTGYVYPVTVASWDSPRDQYDLTLEVDTRLSAVLGIVFGQKVVAFGQEVYWSEIALGFFVVVSVFFLVVELLSLVAGVQLSRSITGAVHELYEATQHVKEGDFSYRIPVQGSDQLAELGTAFNTMTGNLGRLIIVAKEKERLESELAIAREVQNQLFPKDVPFTKTLELKGVCNPARMVSGDYYDFMALPHDSLAFAIGDVAGKGISAALLMATIQSTMRTQISSTNGSGPVGLSTARLVANLNRQLYATTAPEKYATFYFAIYDESRHALTYTNAGHLAPILVRDGRVQLLEPTGTVVGAFPFAAYEEKTVTLEHGDMLVAYTDGIVEPENAYGEMFGEERLQELLVKFTRADSSEVIARAMEAVVQWTGSSELQDDMTMVVARRI